MNVSSSENGENESRYEKVNYPSDSNRQGSDGQEREQRPYQQRNYGYNQNRQGGYNRQEGYGRQGGYQPSAGRLQPEPPARWIRTAASGRISAAER